MDVHQNARTTPHSREKIVARALRGDSARQIAEDLEICESTVRKWLGRYAAEGREGLRDRSCRPHRSPAAVESGSASSSPSIRADSGAVPTTCASCWNHLLPCVIVTIAGFGG